MEWKQIRQKPSALLSFIYTIGKYKITLIAWKHTKPWVSLLEKEVLIKNGNFEMSKVIGYPFNCIYIYPAKSVPPNNQWTG